MPVYDYSIVRASRQSLNGQLNIERAEGDQPQLAGSQFPQWIDLLSALGKDGWDLIERHGDNDNVELFVKKIIG